MTETFEEIQDINKRADVDYNEILDLILHLRKVSTDIDSCAKSLLYLLLKNE